MLHLEAEWPSKKIPNSGHNFGRIRPVARFSGLRGKYIFRGKDFYFYHMFKTNFFEHNKILGGTCFRASATCSKILNVKK